MRIVVYTIGTNGEERQVGWEELSEEYGFMVTGIDFSMNRFIGKAITKKGTTLEGRFGAKSIDFRKHKLKIEENKC